VCRNYAKFEFTVVKDVENKESSCRLGLVRHIWCLVYGGGAVTGVNEGIRVLDRMSAFAVGQRDARFDLNVSGSVMVSVVVVVNGCMVAGYFVV